MHDSFHNQSSANPSAANSVNTSSISMTTQSNDTTLKKHKSLDDYELVNQPNKSNPDLGKGSFGQVKLVRDKSDPKKLYALKIINKKDLMESSSIDYLKREIKIQKKLDHPHIIRLYHYFEDKDNVYLILEYAKNGNLFFYLRRKKTMTEKEAFVYFFQTCIGIDYLHKKGILHRDLKPENLLLDSNGNIKVCDFGWSAEDIGKRNTFCGTVDYMAPEMIQSQAHNFKIDIWSLGILLYELLHGHPPFQGKTPAEKFQNILDKEVKFKEGISSEARDLLSAMLRSDPNARPGFDWIFNHPWIQKHEKEFGVSVKSYVYDPTKKKDKSGKTTPQDMSPASKTATAKEVTSPSAVPAQGISNANQVRTQPFSTDMSPSVASANQVPQQMQTSNTYTKQPDTPQVDFKIPSLNTSSAFDQMMSASGLSSNSLISSVVGSKNNLMDAMTKPINTTAAGSPTKGAKEPVREKSPTRTGIFSPSKLAAESQKSYVDEIMNKPKSTQNVSAGSFNFSDNIKPPHSSPEKKTMSTPKQDKVLPENKFGNQQGQSNLEAYGSTVQDTQSQRDKYKNLSLQSPLNTNYQGFSVNVPEKSSTSQYQATQNIVPSGGTGTTPKSNWSTNQFGIGLPDNKISTPKEQERRNFETKPNDYAYTTITNNYPVSTQQPPEVRNPIISPSSQYSSTHHYGGTLETNVRPPSHASSMQQLSNEKSTRLQPNTPEQQNKLGTPGGDVDFFVPKTESIESTLLKLGSSAKAKSQPVYDNAVEVNPFDSHKGFEFQQSNNPTRMTRVTSLLQKNNNMSDIDQIMEKFLKNDDHGQNGHQYQSGDKGYGVPPNKQAHADHGRVTNIDKYIANYELENTEENMLLDKLDDYYSTGNLQGQDRERYPKREPIEQKREPERPVQNVVEPVRREEPQRIPPIEISFQDDKIEGYSTKRTNGREMVEMSFGDMQRDSEEPSQLRSGYGKEEKKRGVYTQHIEEEDEEEDYNDKKGRNEMKDSRNNNVKAKEVERRQEYQSSYNGGNYEARRPEVQENKYVDPRQQVTGVKRKEQVEEKYQRHQNNQRREEMQGYGARNVEAKKVDDKSFITRMFDEEKRNAQVPNYRMDQKVQSSDAVGYQRGYVADGHREDLMKQYRNRLNGLYHFNSEVPLNFSGLDNSGNFELSRNRNSDNVGDSYSYATNVGNRSYYNIYEKEQEERRERERQQQQQVRGYGGYNERPVQQQYQYQEEDRYNSKRRKEEWPAEYDYRRQGQSYEQGFYSNNARRDQQWDNSPYNEMKKRRQEFNSYMDDDDLEEETVSRPSWRNRREIPKSPGDKDKKELGLIDRITSLFGCLDRSGKDPVVTKTRKGKRAY